MNFKQFQSTREYHDDISDFAECCTDDVSGYLYDGSTYIIHDKEQDKVTPELMNDDYVVYLGNDEQSFGDDLEAAEQYLWDNFAKAECNYIEYCATSEGQDGIRRIKEVTQS